MKRHVNVGGPAKSTPSVPIPPPELLKRAKKLGAISAGPANFSAGVASEASISPRRAKRSASRKPKTKDSKR